MIARISCALTLLGALACGGRADAHSGDSAAAAARSPSTPVGKSQNGETGKMTLQLTSSAFTDGGNIPAKFTCEGEDVSPELAWSGAPPGTRSFAIIVDDPDAPDPAAPKMTYVHWVVYNIPATVTSLAENASMRGMPAGSEQGLNDWKRDRFGGPCPPIGTHRYFFKLYALDTTLTDLDKAMKSGLERAMNGHILAEAQLMGRYAKR